MSSVPRINFRLRIRIEYGYVIRKKGTWIAGRILSVDPRELNLPDLIVLLEDVLDAFSHNTERIEVEFNRTQLAQRMERLEEKARKEQDVLTRKRMVEHIPFPPDRITKHEEVPDCIARRGVTRIDWNQLPPHLKRILFEAELGIEKAKRYASFRGLSWKRYVPGQPFSMFRRTNPWKTKWETSHEVG